MLRHTLLCISIFYMELSQEILALRKNIEDLDDQILRLISKRLEIARLVIGLKNNLQIDAEDASREEYLISRYVKNGQALDMSPDFVREAYNLIFSEAKRTSQKS